MSGEKCSCAEDVVCGACITGAATTAPPVPSREAAARAATEALAAFDRADIFTVLHTVPALAQTLRALLTALTAPPVDDDREVLAKAARDSVDRVGGWKHLRKFSGMSAEWMDTLRDAIICRVVDAVGASGPCRTACNPEPTDAQVLAGLNAELPKKSAAPSLDFYGGDNVGRMCRVLREAAREVCS